MRTFHDEMNPSSDVSKIFLSRSGVKQPAAPFHLPVGPPARSLKVERRHGPVKIPEVIGSGVMTIRYIPVKKK
jgi:hypothetical protein